MDSLKIAEEATGQLAWQESGLNLDYQVNFTKKNIVETEK